MYKALLSFTTIKPYKDVQKGEILESDFDTPEEIEKYLSIGYIEEFNGSLDITENGTYDVTDYEQVDVNVGGGGGGSEYNWSAIGYSEEPQAIEDGYNYAKQIYDNWNNPSTMSFNGDAKLMFFPAVSLANVKQMNLAFNNCYSLLYAKLKITSFTTNMASCFSGCYSLKEIDMTEADTSMVDNMQSMFQYCKFEKFEFKPADTSSVTSIRYMFQYCDKLKEIDLSTFTTQSLTNSGSMFQYCTLLEKIDIRKMELTNITNSGNMFGSSANDGPANNCLIIVKDQTQKDWITTNFSRFTNVKTVAEYEG